MVDFSPVIHEVTQALWWLVPAAILAAILKSPGFKGMVGEFIVKLAARLQLPADTYHRLHNVTLPTHDGSTQIDHIFVSVYGIFVVETKNMKGWIFGGEHQAQWTQKIYRKTFRFQNPLRQNYKHLKTLEAALEVPSDFIHSVVVFAGESSFKTAMPANVTQGAGYVRYIKAFNEEVLSEAQVEGIVEQIKAGRLQPSLKTSREHVRNLKEKNSSASPRICPKCGSGMILRTAKKGPRSGERFWGCSAFPKCRAVMSSD